MDSVCVSVVIPCYNAGKWIDRAIASIKAQDFTDYELIVVDDASNDSLTKEKIAAYQQDPTIRVLVNEQNKGPGTSRNRAVRAAQGRYIATLDADDYYEPTFLGKAVPVMEKRDKVGIVYSYAQFFEGKDLRFMHPYVTMTKELFKNRINASCLFRKKCFDACGGYDEKLLLEDWDFWIHIIALGWKAHCIREFLFFYRVQKDSRISRAFNQPKVHFLGLYEKHRTLYAKHFWNLAWIAMVHYLRNPATLWPETRVLSVFRYAWKENLPAWLYTSLRWFVFRLFMPAYGRYQRVRRFLKRMFSSPSPSKRRA